MNTFIEENNTLCEVLIEKLDGKRLRLNASQRKRLSTKAICLDKRVLQDVAHIFQPETILGWYRKVVGKKYDRHGGKHNGPKPIPAESEELILKMSRNNKTWGYSRIAGYMQYLGYKVSTSTVRRVLDAHGFRSQRRGSPLTGLNSSKHTRILSLPRILSQSRQ